MREAGGKRILPPAPQHPPSAPGPGPRAGSSALPAPAQPMWARKRGRLEVVTASRGALDSPEPRAGKAAEATSPLTSRIPCPRFPKKQPATPGTLAFFPRTPWSLVCCLESGGGHPPRLLIRPRLGRGCHGGARRLQAAPRLGLSVWSRWGWGARAQRGRARSGDTY